MYSFLLCCLAAYQAKLSFEVVQVKPGHVIVRDDPSEDKFIRCAEAGKANIIISGDQHLLSLKSYGKRKILPPSQFLKALQNS